MKFMKAFIDWLLGRNIRRIVIYGYGEDITMKFNKALDLMSTGSVLIQMNKTGDARAWYLVPGGEIDEMVAQDLIKMKNVKPNDDGLFPGISQTWRIRS